MPSSARPRLHRCLLASAALVLLTGVAACGSDDSTSYGASTTVGTGSGAGAADTIVARDFSLSDLTVAPGAQIVLRNDGSKSHTATADDGSFDLGEVSGGATSDPVTAPDQPGSYPFHCEIHASMTATLTVEG